MTAITRLIAKSSQLKNVEALMKPACSCKQQTAYLLFGGFIV